MNWPLFVCTLSISVSAICWIFYRQWYKSGRDLRWGLPARLDGNQEALPREILIQEAVVTEFSPPANISPAIMAQLLYDKVDSLALVCTLLDLARRGYIELQGDMGYELLLKGEKSYRYFRTHKSADALSAHEQALLKQVAKLNHGELNSDAAAFREISGSVYADALMSGYYERSPFLAGHQTGRLGFFLRAGGLVLLLVTGITWGSYPNLNSALIALAIALFLGSFGLFLFGRAMTQKSAHGYDIYREALGFFKFVSESSLHRDRFVKNKELLDVVAIYSRMLNQQTEFRKLLHEMPERRQMDWVTQNGG